MDRLTTKPTFTSRISFSEIKSPKDNRSFTEPHASEVNIFKSKHNLEIQITVLQGAMKIIFLMGNILGLVPISESLKKNNSKIRFRVKLWKMLYGVLISITQLTIVVFCFYVIINIPTSRISFWFTCFSVSTSLASIFCIQVFLKWPSMIVKLSSSKLDDYIDPRIKSKCIAVSIIYFVVALVVQLLRTLEDIATFNSCCPGGRGYVKSMWKKIIFPWITDIDYSYYEIICAFGFLLELWENMILNYPGIFIICVSLYLTSILDQFNTKIISTEDKMMKPSYWKSLREDYGRITSIIRSFDDLMGYITLSTISNNLFFVCFQLYFIFSSSNRHGIYITCSTIFMLLRLLAVVFFTAEVNTTSRAATAFLYKVSSTDFCTEVQRLIDQSHNDEVALSGLRFFSITREFALSVIGTVITYELVLLQFHSDLNKLL